MARLNLNNVLGKKQGYEKQFQNWVGQDNNMPYLDDLLTQMAALSEAVNENVKAEEYIKEAVLGIEILQQAAVMDKMLQVYRAGLTGNALQDSLVKIANSTVGFYKNYDAETDKDVFVALMPLFFEKCATCVPSEFRQQFAENGQSYERWANYVFRSAAADAGKIKMLSIASLSADSNRIVGDPAWQLYNAVNNYRKAAIQPSLSKYYNRMAYMNRLYTKGQMELDNTKPFYPDANLTLRLTYGKIDGINPDGPAGYSYQTNLDEAVAKHNPSVQEFNMPQKLRDLHATKNYGKWAVNGTVPVAFIASNHTSGGNSGSPVLNAKGELIGTNFDRIWEGTMSDLYFDPNLCRNISLDIRYTLFIIEKFGDAGWLLKEMKIVNK
jgi:hypothetical protein